VKAAQSSYRSVVKLRAVDQPLRAIGIVRVSKVGERGDDLISPELQQTAISDHCARRGHQLVDTIEAIDESGSQARSPWWRTLDQTIGRIEAGDADVIVVWKFSRCARQRLRWEIALDRVETAGGALESATEQIDATTSTGRFTRGMLAEIADWEARRIGEGWKEVHARRVSRGLPANGRPRWGYRYVDGGFVPDDVTGPVLADLYRRYVAGEAMWSLMRWLNSNGWRTSPGYSKAGPGLWSVNGLRKTLDSGFAAGLILSHGRHLPGAHQPVISERVWAAYQAARNSRAIHRTHERSRYLLSGLVFCGVCGAKMTGGYYGRNSGGTKFRCSRYGQEHVGGYVKMQPAETAVMEWLRALASDLERAAEATTLQRSRAQRRRRDAARLARDVNALTAQLVRLTRQNTAGVVPDDAYALARDEIVAERDQLELERRQAELESTASRPVVDQVRGMLDRWELWDVELRRGALRILIRSIVLTPGRPPDVVIVPVWE